MMTTSEATSASGSGPVAIRKEPERNRWVATAGPDVIGALTYQFAGGRYVLISTHVDSAYRHRGLASQLVRGALEEIRTTGKKVTVVCPFIGDVMVRHPEYFDLVDPVHPGPGVTGARSESSAAQNHDANGESVGSPPSSEPVDPARIETMRMMVLGAVAHHGALTADDIEQLLGDWNVQATAATRKPLIDRELEALIAGGFIRAEDGRSLGRPEFVCNPHGRAELHDLLLHLLTREATEPFDLIPLLRFVRALTVDELVDGLRRRILRIDEVLAHKVSAIAHAPADGPERASEILRMDWHRYNADRSWSLEFVGRLYGPAGATS
ncbi:GNAT family N-acetyltransferase [Microbacterium sp. NPDC089318]